MTPEMAFECLLLSHDPAVFCTMDRILQDFSIRTNVCSNSSRVASLLAEGHTDLIVIDLESEDSSEVMQQICQSRTGQKPTILAVSAMDCAVPGVHVILRKPVTPESGAKSLKAAYSRMLQDYRKHTRFALMTPVLASDEDNGTLSVTVTNIGEGGVGLTTNREAGSREHLVFSGAAARIEERNLHPGPHSLDPPVWRRRVRVCPNSSGRPPGSACLAGKQVPVQEALNSGLSEEITTHHICLRFS